MTQEETAVQIAVLPGVNLAKEGKAGGVPVMVSLVPPAGTSRTPCDICCVVDVSGSMGTEALLKQADGAMSGRGLSVLDIVKHALKTIIHNMSSVDRLALVAYSNDAKTIFELTEMGPAGRRETEEKLEELQPSGMTNLWDGLKNGMEMLKSQKQPGRLQHVMLFTDGLPNINPPRGIVPMLKRLKDKEGGRLPCTINTFGFGYELDSELLSQVAIEGSGAYAFIPDAGFVGTVFVNSLSNLLVTMAKDATLTLQPLNGASIVEGGMLGGHPMEKKGEAVTLNLGSLQFGQAKQVVARMSVPPDAVESGYLQVSLQYGTRGEPMSAAATGKGSVDAAAMRSVEPQRLRLHFVDTMRKAMQVVKLTAHDKAMEKKVPLPDAQKLIEAMVKDIEKSPSAKEQAMEALLEDVSGQVTEAFSREDWYNKWGIHFLPSLMFAHLCQQCNNFKDAGVQHYGGELFNQLRDVADDVFLNLPPPTPSVRPDPPPNAAMRVGHVIGGPPTLGPSVNMAAFHDRFAGCIDGKCSVQMADGSRRRLSDVRKGDQIATYLGEGHAEVLCCVRTQVPGKRIPLVHLRGDLRVTPYHPVFFEGAWRFPKDLADAKETHCDAVFTLVLQDEGATMVVCDMPCVPLGHCLRDGAAAHSFLGSRQAVNDLSKLPSFKTGLVDLTPSSVLRDPSTGLVCGFVDGGKQEKDT